MTTIDDIRLELAALRMAYENHLHTCHGQPSPLPEPFLGEAHQADLEKAHDDSALRELMGILQYKEDAREVLKRIRAGKVPGVWYNQPIATEKAVLTHDYNAVKDTVMYQIAGVAANPSAADLCRAIHACAERDAYWQKTGPQQEREITTLRASVVELEKEAASRVTANSAIRRNHLMEIDRTVAERDAARAEVAALRARKVKLPGSIGNGTAEIFLASAVRAAIRAAGVEVGS